MTATTQQGCPDWCITEHRRYPNRPCLSGYDFAPVIGSRCPRIEVRAHCDGFDHSVLLTVSPPTAERDIELRLHPNDAAELARLLTRTIGWIEEADK